MVNRMKFVAISALVGFIMAMPCHANPSDDKLEAGLDAHGTISGAKELVAKCYKNLQRIEADLVKMHAPPNDPTKLSGSAISAAAGDIWQLTRDAQTLQLMGEPAGYEIANTTQMLLQPMANKALAFRGTPAGQKLRQKLGSKLTRGLPKLDSFVGKAKAALEAGKVEVVVQQMESKGYELSADLIHFTPEERDRLDSDFFPVIGSATGQYAPILRKKYAAAAAEVAAARSVPATEFADQADRVVGEIVKGESATLGEGVSGGPVEAFDYLAAQWQSASTGLIQAATIEFAFKIGDGAERNAQATELKTKATASLVALVEASAASTSATKVRDLHRQLIDRIGVLQRRMGYTGKDFGKSFEPALAKLAAKDPGFTEQIEAYRRATAEPLAWRKRFASEQTRRASEKVPASTALLVEKSIVESSIRPEFLSRLGAPIPVAPDRISAPSHWVVHEAATRLLGKQVHEKTLLRLSPTSKVGMVPLDGLHYAAVATPDVGGSAAEDLNRSLGITATHGPLTMDAAYASSMASVGDFETVIGVVKGVTMEARITRLITLPSVAYMMVPLGTLPDLEEHGATMQSLVWRLDLQPQWADAGYFTANVQ
ncbi:hypothetical protein Poly51_16100 [Rubripirellula tenax]|uniref:Uncharacterized protein n=1 Tax=Rubripirellula tenax TaxID=2528015 RepID=A0A5C6FE08_9BACT|nr:hypothetical protein [Rubripirellula tenax]TWU58830.1 hypothetical protein Poly51_16100 [Rubripirellula tenax]